MHISDRVKSSAAYFSFGSSPIPAMGFHGIPVLLLVVPAGSPNTICPASSVAASSIGYKVLTTSFAVSSVIIP